MFVPVLGALVCGVLIVSRVHGALTSPVPGVHVAPLVAGGILAAGLVLYRLLKPAAE